MRSFLGSVPKSGLPGFGKKLVGRPRAPGSQPFFCAVSIAGGMLLYGVGARPPPYGVRRGKGRSNLRDAGWPGFSPSPSCKHCGLTQSIVPAGTPLRNQTSSAITALPPPQYRSLAALSVKKQLTAKQLEVNGVCCVRKAKSRQPKAEKLLPFTLIVILALSPRLRELEAENAVL